MKTKSHQMIATNRSQHNKFNFKLPSQLKVVKTIR